LFIALAWEAVARLDLFAQLPAPSAIIVAWLHLLMSGDLIANGIASVIRGVAGLALAILVGSAVGIAMAWWRGIHFLLNPIIELSYPLPKSALIPVTAIWLGYGDGSKVLLIFLGCMLPVTIGAYNGARSTEEVLIWSARGMGASRLRSGGPSAAGQRRRPLQIWLPPAEDRHGKLCRSQPHRGSRKTARENLVQLTAAAR
jgi:NitT/TauT family transport system permease protein